jgi:hypothetical protein
MTAWVPALPSQHTCGNIDSRTLPNRRNIAGNLTIIAREGTKQRSIE